MMSWSKSQLLTGTLRKNTTHFRPNNLVRKLKSQQRQLLGKLISSEVRWWTIRNLNPKKGTIPTQSSCQRKGKKERSLLQKKKNLNKILISIAALIMDSLVLQNMNRMGIANQSLSHMKSQRWQMNIKKVPVKQSANQPNSISILISKTKLSKSPPLVRLILTNFWAANPVSSSKSLIYSLWII